MRGIDFWFISARLVFLGMTLVFLGGCNAQKSTVPAIDVQLYQKWELQSGDKIAGYAVTGGLGDISIALNGGSVYAPFSGEAKIDKRGCVFFSTPNIPAYLFRLCGLTSPKLGRLQQGEVIAKGTTLQFAALRKQPSGTWAVVEPAKDIVERTLKAP